MIPVSSIVNVTISYGTQFPTRAGFGTLNIVANIDPSDSARSPISLIERTRLYNNIDGVGEDWAANTEVYKAASAYFSQNPKPTRLKVSMRTQMQYSPRTIGGVLSPANIAALRLIPNGVIRIDGENHVVDLTGAAGGVSDLQHIAIQLIATINNVQTHVVGDDRISIYDTTLDVPISIEPIPDSLNQPDLGLLLKFLPEAGGQALPLVMAETITQSLNAIEAADSDWYGLAFTKEVRDNIVINGEASTVAAATWCEARRKVFGNTTNDTDVLLSTSDNDIAALLEAKEFRKTMTVYSSQEDEYPSASILGRAFTTNFNQPNSTITLKFKQMPGITREALSQNQKSVLDTKRANALIEVGDRNMFAESFMASGAFFDEVHGVDWLQNAIQTEIFGYLLTRTTKVPYTNKGVAAIEIQLRSVLDEAVRNGLLAPGETIDKEFLPLGYSVATIPVEDISEAIRGTREYPGMSFVALGASAIHRIQINGVFE